MSWPEDFNTNFQFLLRWLHFLGGITWIGMLYFFNLVNVQLQKEIDASIKPKLNPPLLTKTLWWFRWGAVLTWVTGFIYFFVIAHSEAPGDMLILVFLIGWIVAFEINSLVYKASVKGGGLKDGRAVAVVVTIVVTAVAIALAWYGRSRGASSRSLSILLGGGLGTVMFMNVWMIIWPLQKKIIAATKATAETGAAAPAEMPQWARRAFLASRTNAWLSLPMLFFMGAASHFPIFSVITK
jgi:uncharacterized membrane protein